MMESKRILNTLGQIDGKYIEEAEAAVRCETGRGIAGQTVAKAGATQQVVPAKSSGRNSENRKIGYSWGALAAACICVIVLGVSVLGGLGTGDLPYVGTLESGESASPEDETGGGESVSPTKGADGNEDSSLPTGETSAVGITIPPVKVELPKGGVSADMSLFFIYQGRFYAEYEHLKGQEDIVGEYLATVSGSIDEWTSSEDYLELTGSMGGEIYTVKGMNPEFMLCSRFGDYVITYINNSGLTLETGADLFEERLCLTGNYRSVEFETRESWHYSKDEVYALGSEHEAAVSRFVEAMNEAEFMWAKDIPLGEGQNNIYNDKEIYHLYFRMDSGMTVHLRLFEGGYVMFAGVRAVCVQVDADSFDNLINCLTAILQR